MKKLLKYAIIIMAPPLFLFFFFHLLNIGNEGVRLVISICFGAVLSAYILTGMNDKNSSSAQR